jgi:hypothetical protein
LVSVWIFCGQEKAFTAECLLNGCRTWLCLGDGIFGRTIVAQTLTLRLLAIAAGGVLFVTLEMKLADLEHYEIWERNLDSRLLYPPHPTKFDSINCHLLTFIFRFLQVKHPVLTRCLISYTMAQLAGG